MEIKVFINITKTSDLPLPTQTALNCEQNGWKKVQCWM